MVLKKTPSNTQTLLILKKSVILIEDIQIVLEKQHRINNGLNPNSTNVRMTRDKIQE